jgi:hypothetical protein
MRWFRGRVWEGFWPRVLAAFYRTVTVIERNVLSRTPATRQEMPQGPHGRVLLRRGPQIVSELFPSLFDELVALGVPVGYPWQRLIALPQSSFGRCSISSAPATYSAPQSWHASPSTISTDRARARYTLTKSPTRQQDGV